MLGPDRSIKTLAKRESGHGRAETLNWPHLIAPWNSTAVGTSICTLTGLGVERAGPASILTFVTTSVICAFATITYAKKVTLVLAANSARRGHMAG